MNEANGVPTWRDRCETCATWLVQCSLRLFLVSLAVSIFFRFPGIEYDVHPAVMAFCNYSILAGLAVALLGIVVGIASLEWGVVRRGALALFLWVLLIAVTILQGDSVRPLFQPTDEQMTGPAKITNRSETWTSQTRHVDETHNQALRPKARRTLTIPYLPRSGILTREPDPREPPPVHHPRPGSDGEPASTRVPVPHARRR